MIGLHWTNLIIKSQQVWFSIQKNIMKFLFTSSVLCIWIDYDKKNSMNAIMVKNLKRIFSPNLKIIRIIESQILELSGLWFLEFILIIHFEVFNLLLYNKLTFIFTNEFCFLLLKVTKSHKRFYLFLCW